MNGSYLKIAGFSKIQLIKMRSYHIKAAPNPMRVSLVAQLVKNPPAMWEANLGSIPGLGRSPGEGKDYPLQYSDLENSMDCI